MTESLTPTITPESFNKVMRDKAIRWMRAFARQGHYIEPAMAIKIAAWWDDVGAPMLLEGEAGGGKTSVAHVLVKILKAAFYQIQCFKSIGPAHALYMFDNNINRIIAERRCIDGEIPEDISKNDYRAMRKGAIAQALDDDNDNVIVLIDEIDKLPPDDYSEHMLLEVLADHKIAVPESHQFLTRKQGRKPVRFILTSNLGKSGFVEVIGTARRQSLSFPLLRRAHHYIYVPPPSAASQYFILRQAAPKLGPQLVMDCVQFIQRIRDTAMMDKPISLSETKVWVKALQNFEVTELTTQIITVTASTLAKMPIDEERLLAATASTLEFNRAHREEFINKLNDELLVKQIFEETEWSATASESLSEEENHPGLTM